MNQILFFLLCIIVTNSNAQNFSAVENKISRETTSYSILSTNSKILISEHLLDSVFSQAWLQNSDSITARLCAFDINQKTKKYKNFKCDGNQIALLNGGILPIYINSNSHEVVSIRIDFPIKIFNLPLPFNFMTPINNLVVNTLDSNLNTINELILEQDSPVPNYVMSNYSPPKFFKKMNGNFVSISSFTDSTNANTIPYIFEYNSSNGFIQNIVLDSNSMISSTHLVEMADSNFLMFADSYGFTKISHINYSKINSIPLVLPSTEQMFISSKYYRAENFIYSGGMYNKSITGAPDSVFNVLLRYNINGSDFQILSKVPFPIYGTYPFIGRPTNFLFDALDSNYMFVVSNDRFCNIRNSNDTCNSSFAFVSCFKSDGSANWNKNIGGDAGYEVISLSSTKDSGCIIFANRRDVTNIQNTSLDIYYTKLDKDGNIEYNYLPTGMGFYEMTSMKNYDVFPNPAQSQLSIHDQGEGACTIKILDINGKLLIEEKPNNNQTNTIDISCLPSGLYVYKIQTESGKKQTGKFIKE